MKRLTITQINILKEVIKSFPLACSSSSLSKELNIQENIIILECKKLIDSGAVDNESGLSDMAIAKNHNTIASYEKWKV